MHKSLSKLSKLPNTFGTLNTLSNLKFALIRWSRHRRGKLNEILAMVNFFVNNFKRKEINLFGMDPDDLRPLNADRFNYIRKDMQSLLLYYLY